MQQSYSLFVHRKKRGFTCVHGGWLTVYILSNGCQEVSLPAFLLLKLCVFVP